MDDAEPFMVSCVTCQICGTSDALWHDLRVQDHCKCGEIRLVHGARHPHTFRDCAGFAGLSVDVPAISRLRLIAGGLESKMLLEARGEED